MFDNYYTVGYLHQLYTAEYVLLLSLVNNYILGNGWLSGLSTKVIITGEHESHNVTYYPMIKW